MGRRRKGRDISGWLVVDKPAGIGSTDVVNKVRWAFEARKAGHAGTLDPDATGVLAVALGEATKLVSSVADALKAYEFTVTWGAETATDDASGRVLLRSDMRPDAEAIRAALPRFTGDIEQVPPQVSAVKVDGRRAYDLAREGAAPVLTPRPLHVDELSLIDCPDPDTARLRMVCGKGGYVRAIARDLGRTLGCRGHVAVLRRVWSGPFDLDGAVTMDRIEALARSPEIDALLQPVEAGLGDLPLCRVSQVAAQAIRNGNPADVLSSEADFGDLAWASHGERVVALGHYRAGRFHPSRVLNLG
ncbi:tRNA pseudouridine(55) synthase TruB [Palleronia rufa]|uniref:tRNA pseudouridine(55) synthase TruB n=1 Tax=Palleronia rufa TaxID=1530186 RepID=UPI000566C955|nr:tRNA pseudouridine(55) synthase TruB [Palleronia rufa]